MVTSGQVNGQWMESLSDFAGFARQIPVISEGGAKICVIDDCADDYMSWECGFGAFHFREALATYLCKEQYR